MILIIKRLKFSPKNLLQIIIFELIWYTKKIDIEKVNTLGFFEQIVFPHFFLTNCSLFLLKNWPLFNGLHSHVFSILLLHWFIIINYTFFNWVL